MKICKKCDLPKELTEFYRDSSMKDGFKSMCKECKKAYNKTYCAENSEILTARAIAWNRQHWDTHKARLSNHRAAKAGAPVIEAVLPTIVFERDGWICQHPKCLLHVDPDLQWPDPMSKTLDHTVPLASGGIHTYDNVTLMHAKCNRAKGTKALSELVKADA